MIRVLSKLGCIILLCLSTAACARVLGAWEYSGEQGTNENTRACLRKNQAGIPRHARDTLQCLLQVVAINQKHRSESIGGLSGFRCSKQGNVFACSHSFSVRQNGFMTNNYNVYTAEYNLLIDSDIKKGCVKGFYYYYNNSSKVMEEICVEEKGRH